MELCHSGGHEAEGNESVHASIQEAFSLHR